MDELVLGDIARQVISLDKAFITARVGMIEKSTQWDETLYLNWRRFVTTPRNYLNTSLYHTTQLLK
jgi:hypothetical protein